MRKVELDLGIGLGSALVPSSLLIETLVVYYLMHL